MRLSMWVIMMVMAVGAAGCTSHKVEVAPIEVKPIHMTVDINIKVDEKLDEFFDFEDTAPVQGMPVPGTGVQQEGAQP